MISLSRGGTPSEPLPTRRFDIQVMRGVAVLAVLLFHTKESWFTAGYLGVDVFFVISGFVVTPLINRIFFEKQNLSSGDLFAGLRAFYLRRFFRLAPALGVSLMFSLILIFMFGPVSDHLRFASQGLAALLLLGNFGAYHYSGGNYFAPNPNPLIHLWSLSAEEQIYGLLPILIFLLLYITKKRQKFSFQWMILLIGILAYLLDSGLRLFPQFLQNRGISDVSGFMFYSPVSRLWEFCIGGVAYFLSKRFSVTTCNSRKHFRWLVITFLGVLLFFPVNDYKFQALCISILAAVVLYFHSLEVLPIPIRRVLIWLGDRSYSIYLVHMPLLYVAIYSPIFAQHRSLVTTTCFGLSILAGATIYGHIEERFRIKSAASSAPHASLTRVFICFVILPIVFFAGMHIGAARNYWGMDPNPIPPAYASNIDPHCYVSITPCSFPTENPRGEALLIGDSHAASLFQTFTEAMTLNGITSYVWQKNGCQFMVEGNVSPKFAGLIGYGIVRPGEQQTCFTHNESIVNWIKSHSEATIYISQRSSSIRPVGMSETDYRHLVFRNLLHLREISAKLVVIGPNPEFPDATQFFHGGLLIWQKAYVPPKSFLVSTMLKEPERDNHFFASRLPDRGIQYIDSIEPFCTANACTRWEKSGWLYVDHDHLSIFGAEKLKLLIEQQVTSLVAK